MRAIDADAFDERVRAAGGMSEEELTEDFKDGVQAVIYMLSNQPTIQPEPHWIPVTEDTLPEINRVVVVCGDKGTWDFGTYRGHGDNIHFWHWKKNTYKRVYWWMYKEDALPEPFNGGDKW